MLSGSFGFSLTISVSAVPENLLRTSAEVVVSTGLVTFATFELVLTGFKKFSSHSIQYWRFHYYIASVSKGINFLEIV